MARKYKMVKRREQVDETRRRIARATYELHSTIGPAFTTIAEIAERSGLPRQTIYRSFPNQVDLFRSCIAFGLDEHPLPDPAEWQSISDRRERLQTALTELYAWFEDNEPVLTNSVRDIGAVPLAAEAMEPIGEFFQRAQGVLSNGWRETLVAPLISLAIDFSTWKKLRNEHGMSSKAILEFWSRLIGCGQSTG